MHGADACVNPLLAGHNSGQHEGGTRNWSVEHAIERSAKGTCTANHAMGHAMLQPSRAIISRTLTAVHDAKEPLAVAQQVQMEQGANGCRMQDAICANVQVGHRRWRCGLRPGETTCHRLPGWTLCAHLIRCCRLVWPPGLYGVLTFATPHQRQQSALMRL